MSGSQYHFFYNSMAPHPSGKLQYRVMLTFGLILYIMITKV